MALERGNPPRPLISRLVIGLALLSLAAGWMGDLLLAAVIDKYPLALIALNPRNRNLALASPEIAAVPYFLVGFFRLVASDPLNYLIGFWYGDRALAWVQRRSKTYGPLVDDASGFFRRFAYPIIFAAPNNIVCILSGAFGIRPRTFLILNVSGTIARLVVVRQFASYFEGEVNSVTNWITEYRTPILIVSAIAVAWTVFGEFRGDNSEVKALIELEREPERGGEIHPADIVNESGDEASASDDR